MRKLVIAIAALFVTISASARFGVVVGLTSTQTDLKEAYSDIKNATQYHAGIAYNFDLPLGFSIQPSLLYNVKGASINDVQDGEKFTLNVKTGNLELPVRVAWGLDLLIVEPYIFAEPYIGYAITNQVSGADGTPSNVSFDENRFNYGVGIGAGVTVFDFIGLTVKYCWDLGAVKDFNKDNFSNLNVGNSNGIMASLTLYF